jgi:microcystin-dependent protein
MGYVGNQTTNSYSSMDKQVITGNGGASYTLTHAVANAQEIEVFVNNVRQEAGVAYTVAGTALSMTGNVASTDDFYVIYQGKALQTVVPPDGSVTEAKLVSGFGLLPTGMIAPFAMSTAPTGWLECDGSAVSRTTYAVLFAALSTTHGAGNGSTTFNVPDLRGEFIRGWDNGKGTDSGRTFGSSQADELKSHFHRPNNYSTDNTNVFFQGLGSGSGYAYPGVGGSGSYLYSTFADQTDPTGGTETRPRNIAMMYCVKA